MPTSSTQPSGGEVLHREIAAVTTMPELAHVELFAAGVEPANTASVSCLRKAGFRPLSPEPDWEGTAHYIPVPGRPRHARETGDPSHPPARNQPESGIQAQKLSR